MLVDTSLFIDLIRGHPPAIKSFNDFLHSQSTSTIVRMELIIGLKTKKQIKSLERVMADLNIDIAPVTNDVSKNAEKILEKYYHSHGIGILDSFIAATAIAMNETLATHNTQHFSFIPNLKIIKPY